MSMTLERAQQALTPIRAALAALATAAAVTILLNLLVNRPNHDHILGIDLLVGAVNLILAVVVFGIAARVWNSDQSGTRRPGVRRPRHPHHTRLVLHRPAGVRVRCHRARPVRAQPQQQTGDSTVGHRPRRGRAADRGRDHLRRVRTVPQPIIRLAKATVARPTPIGRATNPGQPRHTTTSDHAARCPTQP